MVVVFGLSVAAIAVGFNHAGFSVNYIVTALGIFVDSAIIPMACTILWKKQSLVAVVLAPIISSIAAVIAWLLTAYTHYGEVTITTTSENLPLVAGNMMSLCGPLVLTPLITYLKPSNYDWQLLKEIKSDREASGEPVSAAPVIMGRAPGELGSSESEPAMSIGDDVLDAKLKQARNKACLISVVLCLSFLILWPIPMYGTGYGKKEASRKENDRLQLSASGLTGGLNSILAPVLHRLGRRPFSMGIFRRYRHHLFSGYRELEKPGQLLRICFRLDATMSRPRWGLPHARYYG